MQYTAKLRTVALYTLLGLTFIGVGIVQAAPDKAEAQFHSGVDCNGSVVGSTIGFTTGVCMFSVILLVIFSSAKTLQFSSRPPYSPEWRT
jgi:hypothetical protein